ncbi:MAG: hypothetical protein A2051_10730 [Desulfovibrionales bacterium GWA2_65_9]|nr:MAG: hypothetical protein A2051_10730 [Desulfovibrionales bacterium GWA2_65_9]
MKESTFGPSSAEIVEQMRYIPAMSSLGDRLLTEVVKMAKLRRYAADEVVIVEGASDSWLYFLVLGELLVVHQGVVVHQLDRFGEMFGEMALADHSPRSATVQAITPAVCLALDASHFDSLEPGDRSALKSALNEIICANLAARLREMDRKLAEMSSRPA